MKVNLIIPPDPFLGDDKRNPPLGLLYIAAVTRNAGYEVNITDLRGLKGKDPIEQINLESDIYGYTATTPEFNFVSNLAKKIQSLTSHSVINALGGVHATALPKEIGTEFDKVFIGESELSFLEFLQDLKESKNLNKRFYQSKRINNLDTIPFPARDILPYDSVYSKNAFTVGGDYAATVITSRGCLSDCSFCGSKNMWGRHVKFRSPDNVIQELEQIIQKDNIKYFKFYDDTMVLKKSRLHELCKKIKSLNIYWKAATRVNCTDIDSLSIMQDSGCKELAIGVESLDQDVLDFNHKGITVEQSYQAMRNIKEVGLESRLYFIIGLPGEKPGYSERLKIFLDKTNPDAVDLSTFVPLPGSEIFKNPSNWGIGIKSDEYNKYIFTVGLKKEDSRKLTFEHNVMTEEQIIEEREKCLKIISERKMVKNL